jgi:hypothetical protein
MLKHPAAKVPSALKALFSSLFSRLGFSEAGRFNV